MKISYNWLQQYIKNPLPDPQKVADALTFHAFEVEEIKKIGNDFIFEIDVLPNRAPDCLCHWGVARELAAIFDFKLTINDEATKTESIRKVKKGEVEIKVENENDCPRYSVQIIKGVEVKPSPQWLKTLLEACGLKAINNVVDIANYVMLETGQPIHTFDLKKIGKTIIIRRAKRGEKLKTLDEKTYSLDNDILVIADERRPIAIAGIKGGKETGIEKDTVDILIEAANFNQSIIRRASKKLKLRTDASLRFENGLDPNLIDFAQKRMTQLIKELAGGKPTKKIIDFYPHNKKPKKIILDLNYACSLLGTKIKNREVQNIFQKLGFKIKSSPKPHSLEVEVPTRRLDINIPEDLIEEIGRIKGYDSIKPLFPKTKISPPKMNENRFWYQKIREILKEAGFSEAYNYSFVSEREREIFKVSKLKLISLQNPASLLQKYLRWSLLPNLLINARENLKNFQDVKLFELGKVFLKIPINKNLQRRGKSRERKFALKEEDRLAVLFASKKGGEKNFYHLLGTIEVLFSELGIPDIVLQKPRAPQNKKFWHPNKYAEIKKEGNLLGWIGAIHPLPASLFGSKNCIFACEINFQKIISLASRKKQYQPISPYPPVKRDLAILVPRKQEVRELIERIKKVGGILLTQVELFDVYQGSKIEKDKKSLAFRLTYQSSKRNLKKQEVEKIHQKIIKFLEQNPRWSVRK